MTKHAHHDRGFTLIELVVALSIAALVSVLLLGGYAFASKAWSRADTANDGIAEIYTAQSMLRRAFDSLSFEADKVMFAGDASRLSFVTLFALPGEPPAPTEVSVRVEQCTDGPCMMLAISRPEWSGRNGETVITAPLVRGIEGVSIAYRGMGANDQWQGDWPTGNGAPALVRIDVALRKKSARHWPTLYLAPPSQT